METNENDNIAVQNFWNAAKAVLIGNFIALLAHFKKQEKSQVKSISVCNHHTVNNTRSLRKYSFSFQSYLIKLSYSSY